MTNKELEKKAGTVYCWMLESLTDFCNEAVDNDEEDFQKLYEMVWKKFQGKGA